MSETEPHEPVQQPRAFPPVLEWASRPQLSLKQTAAAVICAVTVTGGALTFLQQRQVDVLTGLIASKEATTEQRDAAYQVEKQTLLRQATDEKRLAIAAQGDGPSSLRILLMSKDAQEAIDALRIAGANIRTPDLIPYFKNALAHESPDVRATACHALGAAWDASGVADELLITSLDDGDERVRIAATSALAHRAPSLLARRLGARLVDAKRSAYERAHLARTLAASNSYAEFPSLIENYQRAGDSLAAAALLVGSHNQLDFKLVESMMAQPEIQRHVLKFLDYRGDADLVGADGEPRYELASLACSLLGRHGTAATRARLLSMADSEKDYFAFGLVTEAANAIAVRLPSKSAK